MDLLFGALVLGVIAVVASVRFGVLGRADRRAGLERFVAQRGFVLNEAADGFEALVGGVRLQARTVVTPGHPVPSTQWIIEGRARRAVVGRLSLRPKHEDAPSALRVGHFRFDEAFLVEGTSHRIAAEVLNEEARRALLAFGPYGESSYDHGAFRFEWEARESNPFDEIDLALAIVAAVCRAPAGYRGGGEAIQDARANRKPT